MSYKDEFKPFKLNKNLSEEKPEEQIKDIKKRDIRYYNDNYDEVVGTGFWVAITIIELSLINYLPRIGPIIILIFAIWFSFSRNINLNIRNFARANLIFLGIAIILIIFQLISI